MRATGAFGWAIAAAVDRVLAGRTVGYALHVQRDGTTMIDHVHGYARAPWENADPGVPWTTSTRCHIASMSKPITGYALALIIEKWNQVLALPGSVHLALPGFPGFPPIPALPPLPWDPGTIGLFLQLCPPNRRPEPQWAYRVYANGKPLTVETKLTTLIGDRLTSAATAGAFVDQLSLRHLLEHHSFLQPIAGDDPRADMWGWISRMLAAGLSASPAPNTGDTYRNENYTLLRAVIENVSGVGYQSYVYNTILAPARAVHFTMQNGDPKPTRYYVQMFPVPDGPPQLPAAGVDFDGDFSAYGGADGWHGSAAEYALFLRALIGHAPTTESAPIVRDHIGVGRTATPAGTVFEHNGEWNWFWGGGAGGGSFDGGFMILPDRTTIVAMTNTSMTIGFQGIIRDAVLSVFPGVDQPRTFLPPIARYGGRVGELRFTTNGADVTPASPSATVDTALALAAAVPNLKMAVFDGAAIVTPQIAASAAPATRRTADIIATTAGLRFLRFPWNKPRAPEVGAPVTQGTSANPTADIAAENAANRQNFAYAWSGWVAVPSDGTYTFATSSDDGSVVWIDDVKVVDNDGLHGTVEVQGRGIALRAGKHPIRIGFLNAGGAAVFELRWITPGTAATVAVPLNALSGV